MTAYSIRLDRKALRLHNYFHKHRIPELLFLSLLVERVKATEFI
jgi:hypothetical protein